MNRDKDFRIKQRERVIKSRKRDLKDAGVEHGKSQPGRYAKQHPLDCGNPRCQLCHYEKVFDIERIEPPPSYEDY